MCTGSYKTNKWAKRVSVKMEKELSMNHHALAEERGVRVTDSRPINQCRDYRIPLYDKKGALTLPRG